MSTSLQAMAQERTEQVMERVRSIWYNTEWATPSIDYNLTGCVGGKAYYSKWMIKLNLGLMKDNIDHYMNGTIPHEIAHLVTFKLCGPNVQPHGPEWKNVMHRMGFVPKRCHNMDVSEVKRVTTTYEYKCSCKTHQVSGRLHNNMLRGSGYKCNKCHTNLRQAHLADQPVQPVQPTKPIIIPVTDFQFPSNCVSKMDKARHIMSLYKDKVARAVIIRLFIKLAGCTPAGAATYYNTLK